MSGDNELLATARAAAALAKKHGASDASAAAFRDREVELTWRDGKLEKISDATSRSVSLSLYVDGRYGSMSTSDLRPEALDRFVQDAIALVRSLSKDPHRKLPDPKLYAGRSEADLQLWDPAVASLTTDDRQKRVRAIEEAARSIKRSDRIVTVTSSVYDAQSEQARVATNGFEGTLRSTNVSSEANVTVKDDDGRRPEDYAAAQTRHLADLPDPASVGRLAADLAVARLGAKKIASGTLPIVVEARAARSLLRHFVAPLSGSAVQQKESFFEGKLGAPVTSAVLTLTDEPLLPRGLSSRPFDSEGMANRSRTLVEKGTLRSFLIDTYYASKMGREPTTGRTTNLVITPGTKALDALLRDLKEGLIITNFLGGNSNATTGAFSLGIAGFRVSKGERAEPIAEMNISGKHLDFWKRLTAVGNDPYLWSSTRTPSLFFEGVSVAGK